MRTWNEKRGFITYLLVNVTCCVCLYFENTLCIYILLYIPWWYFGGMFIINVTFVNLTLSWGIPGYHKLITNKPQIVPFQILSQKHQKLITNQPQIVLFHIYIHISFLKNITNSIPCFNLDIFWLLEVSV